MKSVKVKRERGGEESSSRSSEEEKEEVEEKERKEEVEEKEEKENEEVEDEDKYEPDLDLEADFPQGYTPTFLRRINLYCSGYFERGLKLVD